MNVDVIFEIIKYLIGSLPATIIFLIKYRKNRKADKIKDHKEFLLELEEMYEKVLAHKETILTLSFKNERLIVLNTSLNETIKDLEQIIQHYKEKFSQIEDSS